MLNLVLAVAASLSTSPSTVPIGLPVHIGGRAAAAEPTGYEFGWPGVYFEGRFRGDAVTVSVDAGDEDLEVLVDGVSRGVLRHPGASKRVFAGLGRGEHLVRLEKLTESQTGSSRFVGFFPASGGGALRPPAARARQIEIIGDSYSVGYGDTSPKRTCTPAEIHDTTNTQLAYGPVAAKRLGADYRVNAFSGYGVVRNYDGHDPEHALPLIYDRLIPGDPSRLDLGEPGWRPQLIVVALGTNDFSTPVHPGERWKDRAALAADYRSTYVAFVRRIEGRQPQARFVLLAHADWAAEVQAVADALNASRPNVARVAPYSGLELTGCDWHPSARDQAAVAELVLHASQGFVSFPQADPADRFQPGETADRP